MSWRKTMGQDFMIAWEWNLVRIPHGVPELSPLLHWVSGCMAADFGQVNGVGESMRQLMKSSALY